MVTGLVLSGSIALGAGATVTTTPIYWGALVQGSLYGLPDPGTDMRALDVYESHAGRGVSILHLGQSWYQNGVAIPFPRDAMESVRLHGAIPLLTWGSTDSTLPGTNAPAFRSSVVAGGAYDDFIRSFAIAARDWGHPFFLRFDWEMNGWWYPWAEGQVGTTGQITNGNAPGDYVRMWRHVHDIFTQVGATNVTWVWCINQMSQTSAGVHPPMSQIYPGDGYVDWTSYDAYNRYDGWEDFNTMSTGAGTTWLLNTYQSVLDTAPSKPIMLAEFGSKEDLSTPQRKADWLTDALMTQIPTSFPAIKAIVYYNRNNTTDIVNDPDATVAIESSQQSTNAFAAGINSGYYASNTFANLPSGPIQPLQQAVPATQPGAPALTAATAGSRSVALRWSTPAANGSPITAYRIYRGTAPGNETLLTTIAPATTYLDAEVDVGRSYTYTVAAVNAVGDGAQSNELSATPTGAGLMVSDRFNRSAAAGFGAADVGGTWNVSATSKTAVVNSEGMVYGWTGGNQDVSASGTAVATNIEVLGLVRLSAANPVGGSYSPRVVARAQTDARNGYTARITHTSAGGVAWLLSRIDNAGGTGSLSLASGTLASSGGAGSRWWIRLRAQGTTIQARFWRDGTAEPGTWAASVTDSYWASGRAGLGVFAGTGLAAPYPDTGFATFDAVNLDKTVAATAPAAPSLTTLTGGDRSATAVWSPPASDGGSAVTGYKLYRGTASGGETLLATLGAVTSYTDTSVANGTTYWYRVTAVNAVGESAASNERSITPQATATVPAAPTLTSATAGTGSVALAWSAPASDGGSAVTGYKLYRGTASGAETLLTTLGAVTSYTDTAVTNGTTYWYRVTAVNAVGESAASNERSATPQTTASSPAAPTLTGASAGNAAVALAWSPAASDGGPPVTGYTVYRGIASGAETLLTTLGAVTSYTDTAVANGTTYWYRITAVNSVGESAASNELSATPQALVASVPGAPTLTSAAAGNASVALAWSPPASDGGSTINAYSVYRGTASGGETLLATVGAVTSYTDTTVANGTTYWYRITAANIVGEGAPSNERSATPQVVAASVPGAPTLTSAAAGTGNVALAWTPPTSDGGSAITGYKVYRGTASGNETLLATIGTVTSYTDATVANSTTYWYRITAVNAVGESATSNERSATPQAIAAVPGAPTLTSATAGDANVALVWSPPASDGGSAITGYKVYRGTASGNETLLTTLGAVSTYSDTALANGTTYWYRITAVNAVGESGASNERSATPQGATLFVLDGFDRTVASGFGVAQTGGTWTVSSSTQTKVQNSEGVMYGIAAGQDVRASIGSSTANQEILVLTRLSAADPVGGGYDVRAVARAQTDTRRGYVARVGHTSTGGVTWTLTLVKNTNGSGGTVTLGSGTLATSGAAGSSWWIRLRVKGTSISVKYWQNGTAEPTAWTRTATDGTFSAGTVSVGVAGSSTLTRSVTDVGFASVQATKLG